MGGWGKRGTPLIFLPPIAYHKSMMRDPLGFSAADFDVRTGDAARWAEECRHFPDDFLFRGSPYKRPIRAYNRV